MSGFRNPVDTYRWPPKFIFVPNLESFSNLFKRVGFQFYLKNSLIAGCLSTLSAVLIAAPAAYALCHLRLKGKYAFLFALLAGRMLPPVALIVPIYLMAAGLGQLDRHQVLVVVYTVFNLPFAIWLLRSFFSEVPQEVREAAMLDGCSEFGIFRRVILPISASGIAATAVFTFIACWNEFLLALALTTHKAMTAPVITASFRTQMGILWGEVGAAALLISAPPILFAMIMQRYFVRGMTMGALK